MERKNWHADPEILVKATKWTQNSNSKKECPAVVTKPTKKEAKTLFICPYKYPHHQTNKLYRQQQSYSSKEKPESKYRKHNCVLEDLKQERLRTIKFSKKKIPYKPPLNVHNCIFRHWSTEEIQVETEVKAEIKKSKNKNRLPLTKTIRIRYLKPGLKPKVRQVIPNDSSIVRKTIEDFLPKYLKQTPNAKVCKETQIPGTDQSNHKKVYEKHNY